MSKLKNNYICGNCKHYEDCLNAASGIDQSFNEDSTCFDWEEKPTEEDLEAQRTDAAEKETHRKEVEGEDLI